MERRQLVLGGLSLMVGYSALAAPARKSRQRWKARIKGCLCRGCGNKLKDKLAKMPGVVGATVDVQSGDVEVISTDKRTTQRTIRTTIETTNFTVISIKGPFEL